jgi:hypothetical protein
MRKPAAAGFLSTAYRQTQLGDPSRAPLTQRARCGELHVTSQRLALFSAVHDVLALLELTELEVLPVLFEVEILESLCEVIPAVDEFDSTELVTLLDVVEPVEVLTPAG